MGSHPIRASKAAAEVCWALESGAKTERMMKEQQNHKTIIAVFPMAEFQTILVGVLTLWCRRFVCSNTSECGRRWSHKAIAVAVGDDLGLVGERRGGANIGG